MKKLTFMFSSLLMLMSLQMSYAASGAGGGGGGGGGNSGTGGICSRSVFVLGWCGENGWEEHPSGTNRTTAVCNPSPELLKTCAELGMEAEAWKLDGAVPTENAQCAEGINSQCESLE